MQRRRFELIGARTRLAAKGIFGMFGEILGSGPWRATGLGRVMTATLSVGTHGCGRDDEPWGFLVLPRRQNCAAFFLFLFVSVWGIL